MWQQFISSPYVVLLLLPLKQRALIFPWLSACYLGCIHYFSGRKFRNPTLIGRV